MIQGNTQLEPKIPRVFISYSWESEKHKSWVRHLAEDLRRSGVDARLDQWYVKPGESFTAFMEYEVKNADYVLAICTPEFAKKSDARKGGVGYEQQIVSGQLVSGSPRKKFIPLLRSGDISGVNNALPTHFLGAYSIDFRDDSMFDNSLGELLRALFSRPRFVPPPIGKPPDIFNEMDDLGHIEEEETKFMPSATSVGFVGITERGPTRPTLIFSWEDYKHFFGNETDPQISFLSHSIKGFFENGGNRAYVVRVVGKECSKAKKCLVSPNGEDFLCIEALYHGSWGNHIFIKFQTGTRAGFRLTISYYGKYLPLSQSLLSKKEIEPLIQEDFDNLSLDLDGPNYVKDVVNSTSTLINVPWCEELHHPEGRISTTVQLAEGCDGTAIKATDYIGDSSSSSEVDGGLAALKDIDDISLICVPDHVHPSLNQDDQKKLTNALIDQCELLHDRFAILSVGSGVKDFDAITLRDTSYAAIYYPWLRIFDQVSGRNILIPSVGHMAGIFAQNDVREGVHIAPVNISVRGILKQNGTKNVSPLEFEVSAMEQDILDRKGINYFSIVEKDKFEIRVATAYTMSIEYQWRYINVRRFCDFLLESIKLGTKWVLFERNKEELWTKVRNIITEFLTKIWEDGALRGDTADEAFFVRCDRTTMTDDDIKNGRMICMIGASLLEPEMVIMFHLIMNTTPDLDHSNG